MILVDTSVWINHLRADNTVLTRLLINGRVLAHPAIIGEIALGHLSRRGEFIGLLQNLPVAKVASDSEVMDLIENNRLFGLGIGFVDVHLLAAALLTVGAGFWTEDKRLAVAASRLGLQATSS